MKLADTIELCRRLITVAGGIPHSLSWLEMALREAIYCAGDMRAEALERLIA